MDNNFSAGCGMGLTTTVTRGLWSVTLLDSDWLGALTFSIFGYLVKRKLTSLNTEP